MMRHCSTYMVCCLRSLIINILFKVLHLFTYIFCMLVFLAVMPLGSLYTPPPSKRKKNLVRKRFQIHWQKLLYSIIYVAVRELEKKLLLKSSDWEWEDLFANLSSPPTRNSTSSRRSWSFPITEWRRKGQGNLFNFSPPREIIY